MSAKKIAFIVLCVLLATVLIMTCVVIARVGDMLSGLNTPTPTTPTAPATDPTTAATVPTHATDPTQVTHPTEPQPTDPAPTDPTDPTDHEHDYVLTESGNATCENYGYCVYTCSICGNQIIPNEDLTDPLGHNYGAAQHIAPTCTTDGCKRYTCTRCGKSEDRNVQPATGHAFELAETVPASCEADGYSLYRCTHCGEEEQRDIVTAAGHTYETTQSMAPSCTAGGYEQKLCSHCGAEDLVTTPALGHSFGEWVTDPDGTIGHTCGVCGVTQSTRNMAITGTQTSAGDGNACKIYVLSVGTADDPDALHYTVYDYRQTDTPEFHFDAVHGLQVSFMGTLGDIETLSIPLLDTDPLILSAG